MTLMEREIKAQPQALLRCAEYNANGVLAVAKKILEANCRHVILVARGSSDNACMFFKYLLETKLGKPVVFFHPSVITMYDAPYDFSSSVVIGVSQSGQAADCLAVMERAKACGAFVAAITNFENAPMAKCANVHLFMNVGLEQSVAATKTMTAEMLLLAQIVGACTSENERYKETVDAVLCALEKDEEAALIAECLSKENQLVVLSRGAALSAAFEIALKLQETCYINARPYAISDFYHGPFALASEIMPFIVVSVDENTRKDSFAIVERLKKVGSKVYVISDDEKLCALADKSVRLKSSAIYSAPIAAVVAGQLVALRLIYH